MAICVWMLFEVIASAFSVQGLRCEYRINPTGVDVTEPRLSWILSSDERGQNQTAYQVLVAGSAEQLSRNEGNLWDSGKVRTNQTIHIVSRGKPLQSRAQAFW